MKILKKSISFLMVLMAVQTASAQVPAKELVYPKPQDPLEFGTSVALYDQYAVVGAEYENDTYLNGEANTYSGTIRLFKNNQYVRRYVFGNGVTMGLAKKNTIAIGPNAIVAGLPSRIINGKYSGSVVIANRTTNGDYHTTLNYNLTPNSTDVAENLQFGCSVTTDGDWIAIGAKGRNGNRGGVYLFRRTGYWQWERKGWLNHPSLALNTYFGESVKISGDQMIVSGGNKVHFYRLINNSWAFTGSGNTGPDIMVKQVDITGNYAVASGSGPVHVFRKTGTSTWSSFQTITGDIQFGLDVAISNQNLIISNNIKVYYYQLQNYFTRIGSMYIPQTNTATGRTNKQRVGFEVDIEGEKIIIGASNSNYTSGNNQGAVFTDFFYNGFQNPNHLRAANSESEGAFIGAVFPNPSATNVSVNAEGDVIKVSAANMTGEKTTLDFEGNTLFVENLNSGVYILNVETTEGTFVTKFVKQ